MADLFTAVRMTSELINLVIFARKVVRTAYQIYEADSDVDIEHADHKIHESLSRLDTSILRVVHTRPFEGDDNLLILVERCKSIGREIAEILKMTKCAKRSIGGSLVTAVRKALKEKKLKRQKSELCELMSLLQVELYTLTQSENNKQITRILEMVQSAESQSASRVNFLSSLEYKQQLEIDMFTKVQDFFIFTDEASKAINEQRILNALNPPDLTARLKSVHEASQNTFGWCMKETDIPRSHQNLKISFRDWLIDGDGVFHIEGKPGCGKSTLMKFIVDHNETTSLLRKWSKSRVLIAGSFFFWKKGTELQRNLEGLLRSLTYIILSKLPHLIEPVFPQHFDQRQILSRLPENELKLGYAEIRKSFSDLMSRCALEDHHICFFIDGLDEFSDPDNSVDKEDLAALIMDSTSPKARNIKFCVSSRKEHPFRGNFPADQRLELHLLTKADIRTTVSQKLEGHKKFKSWSYGNQQKLIEEVVNRANGVFLWVSLVLAVIREALSEDQSLQYIMKRLCVIPEELEQFYKQIIDSIPSENKAEAWAIFAMVATTQNLRLGGKPNLLHLSFLEELVEIRTPSNTKPPPNSSFLDIVGQAKSFKSRLQTRCRGLVEPLREYGVNYVFEDLEPFESLTFIHRSLAEYFENWQQHCPKAFRNFDPHVATIRCFILELTLIPYTKMSITHLASRSYELISWLRNYTVTSEVCEELGNLEDTLLKWQHGSNTTKEIDWTKFKGSILANKPLKSGDYLSITACSCFYGLRSYVEWSLTHQLLLTSGNQTRLELLHAACEGAKNNYEGWVPETYHFILKTIATSESIAAQNDGLSTWQSFLQRDLTDQKAYFQLVSWRFNNEAHPFLWKGIQYFLESGADPYVVWTKLATLDLSSYDMKVRQDDGHDVVVHPFIVETKWIPGLDYDDNAARTFREVVEFCQPSDMEEILSLIDRNMEALYPRLKRCPALTRRMVQWTTQQLWTTNF